MNRKEMIEALKELIKECKNSKGCIDCKFDSKNGEGDCVIRSCYDSPDMWKLNE